MDLYLYSKPPYILSPRPIPILDLKFSFWEYILFDINVIKIMYRYNFIFFNYTILF